MSRTGQLRTGPARQLSAFPPPDISIGIDDLIIPEGKEKMVLGAQKDVIEVEKQYLDGAITNGERYNKVISIW